MSIDDDDNGAVPTFSEVIVKAIESHLAGELHVSMPGRIERYSSATQRADIQPLLRRVVIGEDGSRIAYRRAVVPNVPIMFLGGGGFRTTYPVAVGDTALLIFVDVSIDRWKTTGNEVDPGDDRAHSVTDAVALVGLRARPWTSAPGNVATTGMDGGPVVEYSATEIRVGGAGAQPTILAPAYRAAENLVLDAIATAIAAIPGGGPAATALRAVITTFKAGNASYLSTIAKVR